MKLGSEITGDQQRVRDPPLMLSLDMYSVPPTFDLRLSELIEVSIARLKILQQIETFVENRKNEPDQENFYKKIAGFVRDAPVFDDGKHDLASHWMLKFAFLNDEVDETENFFKFLERMVFAGRLYVEAERNSDINHDTAVVDEAIKIKLNDYFFKFLGKYLEQEYSTLPGQANSKFLKIPFRYAGPLIEKYEVEICDGFAYIQPYNSYRMIQDLFGEIMFIQYKQLKEVEKAMRARDPRLTELREAIRKEKKEKVFYEMHTSFNISYQSVANLAPKHFPLCMEEIYDSLKSKHMLKHWGRLQFGLFLKGIGLSLEDNISLFSTELKKSATAVKKVSEYKYYLEHMYGKKGKKVEYTPWGCQKMATKSTPAAEEVFGCPFKYYSDPFLSKTLRKKGLDATEVEEVLSARNAAYTQGCRKYYQKTHPDVKIRDAIGKHPNGYFASSLYASKYGKNEANGTNKDNDIDIEDS